MEQIKIFYLKQTSNNEIVDVGLYSTMRTTQQKIQRENKKETLLKSLLVPNDKWRNGEINLSTLNNYL